MKKFIAITACSNILFGLIPVYWKFLGDVDTLYILGQRILWSVPFTLIIVLLSRKWDELKAALRSRRVMLLTAAAGVIITANWYLYIWAVNASMVLETSLAYYMAPLIAFVLGVFAFREKTSPVDVASIIIAAVGILISTLALGVFPWVSVLLALTFSVYGALKKAAGLTPAVSLTLEMLVVLPFALIFLAFTSFGPQGALTGISPVTMLLLVGTGFISSFPLWLYSYGVKELPFSLVAFLQFIWPTTSMLLSVFAFHETLTPAKLVCFLFIWAGVLLFTCNKVRQGRKA